MVLIVCGSYAYCGVLSAYFAGLMVCFCLVIGKLICFWYDSLCYVLCCVLYLLFLSCLRLGWFVLLITLCCSGFDCLVDGLFGLFCGLDMIL